MLRGTIFNAPTCGHRLKLFVCLQRHGRPREAAVQSRAAEADFVGCKASPRCLKMYPQRLEWRGLSLTQSQAAPSSPMAGSPLKAATLVSIKGHQDTFIWLKSGPVPICFTAVGRPALTPFKNSRVLTAVRPADSTERSGASGGAQIHPGMEIQRK